MRKSTGHPSGTINDTQTTRAQRLARKDRPTAREQFYYRPVYQGLKAIRDECSSARLISVEGRSE
jgi:uncharacterized protein (DUF1330 family)